MSNVVAFVEILTGCERSAVLEALTGGPDAAARAALLHELPRRGIRFVTDGVSTAQVAELAAQAVRRKRWFAGSEFALLGTAGGEA